MKIAANGGRSHGQWPDGGVDNLQINSESPRREEIRSRKTRENGSPLFSEPKPFFCEDAGQRQGGKYHSTTVNVDEQKAGS